MASVALMGKRSGRGKEKEIGADKWDRQEIRGIFVFLFVVIGSNYKKIKDSIIKFYKG